jgi:hypothetical protein
MMILGDGTWKTFDKANEIDKNYERSWEIMQIYLLKAKQKTIEA